MYPITISTQISQGDYLKLSYLLTYRKPIIIFCTIAGAVMLTFSLLHFAGLYMVDIQSPYIPLVAGFFMAVYIPIAVYRNAIKTFRSNKLLQERINYLFDLEKVSVQGESFNSELAWKNIHKILELKNWVLIYQNSAVANLVPKKSMRGEQLSDFKKLIHEVTERHKILNKKKKVKILWTK